MYYTKKLTITTKQAISLCKYIRKHVVFMDCDKLHHTRKERHQTVELCPVEEKLNFAIDAILNHLEEKANGK